MKLCFCCRHNYNYSTTSTFCGFDKTQLSGDISLIYLNFFKSYLFWYIYFILLNCHVYYWCCDANGTPSIDMITVLCIYCQHNAINSTLWRSINVYCSKFNEQFSPWRAAHTLTEIRSTCLLTFRYTYSGSLLPVSQCQVALVDAGFIFVHELFSWTSCGKVIISFLVHVKRETSPSNTHSVSL